MKIAVFGGSFDPIHNGHLALARGVAKRLGIDRVILMPSAQSPHKLKTETAAGEHRAAMCRLATAGDPLFEVSEWELSRGGASFTADTLDALCAAHADATWYLLTGADMFLTLGTWFRFPAIAQAATLCTVPRDGVTAEQLEAYADTLRGRGARCEVVSCEVPRISSTEIRACIKTGDAWETWVPSAVADYIRTHKLYQTASGAAATDAQLTEILEHRLTPYRFAHSLAVAREARRLATRYGEDPARAYTAGLIHDILRETPAEEQLQIARDLGIELDAVERQSPPLWHARLGAAFCENILGITDAAILSAVRYHTTAHAEMTLLEEILYVADLTAEGRNYDDVDVVRALTERSLDEATEYILEWQIHNLESKGRPVHPDTLAALAWIQRKKG